MSLTTAEARFQSPSKPKTAEFLLTTRPNKAKAKKKMEKLEKGNALQKKEANYSLDDAEATVIAGHQNGKQSIKVRDAEGHEFRLTCPDNLEIGDIVTYQFNGRTKNGIPRHAAFLRIR